MGLSTYNKGKPGGMTFKPVCCLLQPLEESSRCAGYIKYGKFQLQPAIVGLLFFDNGHGFLKGSPASPELSFQRKGGKIASKCSRRIQMISIFTEHLLTASQ